MLYVSLYVPLQTFIPETKKDYGVGPVSICRSAVFWFYMCLSVWLAMCTHTDVLCAYWEYTLSFDAVWTW